MVVVCLVLIRKPLIFLTKSLCFDELLPFILVDGTYSFNELKNPSKKKVTIPTECSQVVRF